MLASESSWEGTMLYFIWQAIPPFFREGPYKTKKNSKTKSIVALSFFSKPNVMYWQVEPIVGYSPGKWQLLCWKGKNSKFRNFHKKSHKMSKKFSPSSLPKKSCDVRAYPGVLRKIVTMSKRIFTFTFNYLLFFCNPSHKTETGTAKRWGTTNSKPLGPIIIMGQKLDHIYCTLFCRYTAFLRLFVATANDAIMLSQNQFPEPKPISWAKPTCFDISSSVQDHTHTEHGWRCCSCEVVWIHHIDKNTVLCAQITFDCLKNTVQYEPCGCQYYDMHVDQPHEPQLS